MFRSTLVLLALSATLAAAKVFVLDDNNFDQTLAEHHPMLVEFYAPWCGHCKALEPEYDAAGKTLADKKSAVYLGKVDATSESASELAKRFNVEGFPTLKYFENGKPSGQVIDYDGERNAQNIVSWLEKKIGPAFVTLASDADLNKAKATVTADNEKIVVIGAFNNKDQMHEFEEVAKKDFSRDFYAVVGNAALSKSLDASASVPFLKVLRSFNMSNPAVLTNVEALGDSALIEKFLAKASVADSIVVAYDDSDIFNTVRTGYHVVEFYAPWCGYCKQFAPKYEKIAEYFQTKGAATKVVVAKYDGTTNEDVTEKEKIDSFPTIKLYRDGLSTSYKGDMEEEAVIKFIEEKAKTSALPIKSESDVASFVADIPSALVGCVTPANEGRIDAIAFQAASSSFKVGKLRCEEGKESVVVYENGQKRTEYPKTSRVDDVAALTKWYKRASITPVFKFDDEIFDEVIGADYKYIVFYFDNQLNGDEPALNLFKKLAESERFPDTAYAYSTSSEEYLLQYFQLKADALPAVRLLDVQGSMTSYVGPTEISEKSLAAMFSDLEDGSLEKVAAASEEGETEEEGGDEHDHEHDSEIEGEDADDEEDDDEEEDEQDEL